MMRTNTIRKTQDFLIEQAKIHDSCIIDNVDVTETVDIMVNEIIEKYGGLKNVEQKSE